MNSKTPHSPVPFSRRGSALLVVLGMLAFMVISAVAFSAYMRHSRLPSSYLRRASSSRHLAKAALAEAIDIIDAAIGNDRYPGQGDSGGTYRYPRHDGRSEKRNYWTERCFIGTNQCASVDSTVSTLCLEGLAYLPPAIINEARYWSRRSMAATWHTFGFDSGRFAFSAFDLSDCLDISRLMADYGRDSSDAGRINLAYAFENAAHSGHEIQPSAWDAFMEKFRDEDGRPDSSKVPLTSLADFNLALHKEGLMVSPFCRFIENGTPFVNAETGSEAELQRHMLFTADGWYPQTNRASGTTIDLANGLHQPLSGLGSDTYNRNEAGFDQVAQNNNTFMQTYASRITPATMAQLYDYLDRDSIPISLALPTAERTPMVTGFSLQGMLSVVPSAMAVRDGAQVAAAQGTRAKKYKINPYGLKLQGEMNLAVGAVFPFKYKRGNQRKFKAQAAMTITFVPVGSENDLRPGVESWATVPVWPNGSKNAEIAFYQGVDRPSGATVYSDAKDLTFKDDIREEDDANVQSDVMLQLNVNGLDLAVKMAPSGYNAPGAPEDVCAYRAVDEYEVDPTTGQEVLTEADKETTVGVYPSNAKLGAPFAQTPSAPISGEFTPVVQIWVRILDPENNVVDLVPACVADDKAQSTFIAQASGSSVRPALRFHGEASSTKMTFDRNFFKGGGVSISQFQPQAYITDDPRFNYAPENFAAFATLDGQIHAMWMDKQRSENRDGDIFMTTSDAGYLQSPYELANLLRFSGLTGGSGWGILQNGEHGGYNGRARNGFEDLAAESAMWRTFSQYDVNGGWDDIAGLDIRTGSKGFRMTPYAASKETMMSVFANTPLDWWAASTNDVQDAYGSAKTAMLGSLAEALKYTFSKHSGAQVQIEWDDLQSVAEYVRGVFRGNSGSWEDVWDDLAWDYNHSDESSQEKLFGIDLRKPLHSVDRKFLHGYWRECFANRQQLFLIFVRAEPMMMGGGAIGQSPPQLGARAVALVWRDPNPTGLTDDGGPIPHRTRVLFYRQFD